jgi:hypothetical protein
MKIDIWGFLGTHENTNLSEVGEYMETCVFLWKYITELFLEWEMFQINL